MILRLMTMSAVLATFLATARRPAIVRAFSNAPSIARRSAGSLNGASRVASIPNIIRPGQPISLCMSTASTTSDLTEEQKAELEAQIKAKGDEIRALKDGGADKAAVAPLVEELLALKSRLDPDSVKPKKKKGGNNNNNNNSQKKKGGGKNQQQNNASDDAESDYITPRSEDYSKWYASIIRNAGLAESSPVRGCMVIKPWGMSLWDIVRTDLDARIKSHDVENAYFPMLIPKSFLSKEAEHVDGFAKECAVVTHHRLTADPSGEKGLIADPDAELEDPLIIRPTSETMIWNTFRKWIVSHR
jgi:prolyl-tRNA synthetase